MTDSAPSSSLAQLLALIQGSNQGPQSQAFGGAPPGGQYPVQQGMAQPGMVGPMNQTQQPMPQGLPPNIMAMWAAMTPQQRAQYMAATQGNMAGGMGGNPQMANMGAPPQGGPAPTNLSLSPAMLQQYAALQPQAQYGDPMQMRPGSAQLQALTQMNLNARQAYGTPDQ